MKRLLSLLLSAVCVLGLAGCGDGAVSEAKVVYGNSVIYSKEDMDAAIKLIIDEFSTWEGCELHSITYSSDDECNSENITWMNELASGQDFTGNFTQCIMFKSDFHSPNMTIQSSHNE